MEKKQKDFKKLTLFTSIVLFVGTFVWMLMFISSLTGEKEKLIIIILRGFCVAIGLAGAIVSLIRYKKLKKAEMQTSAEKVEDSF